MKPSMNEKRVGSPRHMVLVLVEGALVLGVLSACGGVAAETVSGSPAIVTGATGPEQCQGIPVKEQQMGLVTFREAIVSAAPVRELKAAGKAHMPMDRGVELAILAQPGMSAPWLTRVATCHIAALRAGRVGSAGLAADPLASPGAVVYVREASSGYLVSVTGESLESALDIVGRARALMSLPKESVASVVAP